MYKDTAGLFNIFLIVFGFRAIFLFVSVGNPAFFAALILYLFAIWSIIKDGRHFKFIYTAMLVDFITLFATGLISNTVQVILLLVPIFLIFILSLFMQRFINTEYMLFKRTVKSFNDDDLRKARIALRTMDPEDIAKVAEYTDWKTIS